MRKKYVLPGGIIPGPNKPKNLDSFLFPGIHHLAALQKDGLRVWDSSRCACFLADVYFALGTADGPGMAYLNGLVGHHGGHGCRLNCGMRGRHKPGGTHYFPAALKPHNFTVAGSVHDDVDLRLPRKHDLDRYGQDLRRVLMSENERQYKKNRLETGIVKPSLFSGLSSRHILGVPGCFAIDLMHLISLNLPDLLISLWRGTLYCDETDDKATWDWAVLRGDTWKSHGQAVASMTPYLPGSFDRPPRNPAEKISSGYKAWEFLLYVFALGPAVFRGILPDKYWRNFCKLVSGVRLIQQQHISRSQLREAHTTLVQFAMEFEQLYYQRRADRLHFVRQSIHLLIHIAPEVHRLGPPALYTQWTMERTIGNLGEEIRQPSNPFSNLSERGLRRARVNALKAIIPDLDPPQSPPTNSINVSSGYRLLHPTDTTQRPLRDCEGEALKKYLMSQGVQFSELWKPLATRWARLQLPTGQISRSHWKESLKPLAKLRIARMVKLDFEGQERFAEVIFYFRHQVNNIAQTLALVSLLSLPDQNFLKVSYGTLVVCSHLGDDGLVVVPVTSIRSVIALPPLPPTTEEIAKGLTEADRNRFFVSEKPGLDVVHLGGADEACT